MSANLNCDYNYGGSSNTHANLSLVVFIYLTKVHVRDSYNMYVSGIMCKQNNTPAVEEMYTQ